MDREVILTISVLTSRKEEQVRRCLESLRPIREAIPSELIIVDTSEDGHMHAVVSEYTDKVVDVHWINDFSAARNVGLERARGEWFLYLDDDEYFTKVDPIIDFFESGKYKSFDGAMYIQRNYFDLEGRQKNDMWASRLARISPELHFTSLIHEYMEPVPERSIGLDAVVDHYGYAGLSDEVEQKKFERNYPLLQKMMEKEPDEPRWRSHILMELWNVGKMEELRDFAEKCLKYYKDNESAKVSNAVAAFYAARFLVYVEWIRDDLARQECVRALSDKRLSLLGRAYFKNRLAKYLLEENDLEGAIEGAGFYLDHMEYLKKGGQDQMFQKSVAFIMNTYDEQYVMLAYQILICAGLKKGDTSYLERYFGKLGIENDPIYIYPGLVPAILDAVYDMELDAVEGCEIARQEIGLDESSSKPEIKKGESRLFIRVFSGFHSNEEIWQKLELMILEYMNEHENAFEKLEPLLCGSGVDLSFFRLYSLRKRLSNPDDSLVEEELLQVLKRYIDYGKKYYSSLLEDVDEKDYPSDYKGILILSDIPAQSDLQTKLSLIKETVKTYPPFAEVMKRYANYLGEQEAAKNKEMPSCGGDVVQDPKMEDLAREIVLNVRLMLDGGMYKEAAPVIEQLKKMVPGNLEVMELERELKSR